ncbi:MAG: SDR family oxidoreductase [Mycobacteriales bacterium]
MDLGLHGRCYVATGASRGLGFATARALVDEGAHVVLSARDSSGVDDAVAELGAAHAVGVPGDLADPALPDALCGAALAHAGRLDGALISVGGPPPGGALEVTDEQWRQAFDAIFLGAVRLARTVAAALTDGGSVAFVLSSSVRTPIGGLVVSNGLRPGLAMVAKTLADELGSRGIRVNALLPGRIATDRTLFLDESSGDAAAARAANQAAIPLGRYGEPAEFGRAAAFLLSPAASYITGTTLAVDGGALRGL